MTRGKSNLGPVKLPLRDHQPTGLPTASAGHRDEHNLLASTDLEANTSPKQMSAFKTHSKGNPFLPGIAGAAPTQLMHELEAEPTSPEPHADTSTHIHLPVIPSAHERGLENQQSWKSHPLVTWTPPSAEKGRPNLLRTASAQPLELSTTQGPRCFYPTPAT